ncbi:MAG: glycosyltransferase family 25 protein [Flavisolibacter sp.]|nr:glycosyltransferase family 25 protein [Flavisolibacter sp.]
MNQKDEALLFFDAIYLINLPARKDRLNKWQKSAKRINFQHPNFNLFKAINGEELHNPAWKFQPGALGCLESHLLILKEARNKSYKNVLIFEDDFLFHRKFKKYLSDAIKELPAKWDMFYLYSDHHEKPSEYSKNLVKCKVTIGGVAYAVNSNLYDFLIEEIEARDKQLDVVYASIHAKTDSFATRKNICIHYDGFSDILKEKTNYHRSRAWYMIRSLKTRIYKLIIFLSKI